MEPTPPPTLNSFFLVLLKANFLFRQFTFLSFSQVTTVMVTPSPRKAGFPCFPLFTTAKFTPTWPPPAHPSDQVKPVAYPLSHILPAQVPPDPPNPNSASTNLPHLRTLFRLKETENRLFPPIDSSTSRPKNMTCLSDNFYFLHFSFSKFGFKPSTVFLMLVAPKWQFTPPPLLILPESPLPPNKMITFGLFSLLLPNFSSSKDISRASSPESSSSSTSPPLHTLLAGGLVCYFNLASPPRQVGSLSLR